MSICVAVSVPDGIALAADTRTAWFSSLDSVKGRGHNHILLDHPVQIPLGWTSLGRKLFNVKFSDTIFGICTSGNALIGKKTIYTIIKSLERVYNGPSDFDHVRDYIIEALKQEFIKYFGTDNLKECNYIDVDLIITGFDDADVSKPRIESYTIFSGIYRLPELRHNDTGIHQTFTNLRNGEHCFDICYIGEESYVAHVVRHQKDELPCLLEYLNLFSIADALDFSKFLVAFTCDYQRFAAIVPTCGRPIVAATFTPDGFDEITEN